MQNRDTERSRKIKIPIPGDDDYNRTTKIFLEALKEDDEGGQTKEDDETGDHISPCI